MVEETPSKARVFTAESVDDCERVLVQGGKLHVATDVKDYCEVMQGLLAIQEQMKPIPVPRLRLPNTTWTT